MSTSPRRAIIRACSVPVLLCSFAPSVLAQALQEVQVISTTPLPGAAISKDKAPFSVKEVNDLNREL